MKTVIIDEATDHGINFQLAFILGYNRSGGNIDTDVVPISGNSDTVQGLELAKSYNCKVAVKSYTGASSVRPISDLYYPQTTLFMPTGANSVGEIYTIPIYPSLCVTGAGDVENETASQVEFIAPDPISAYFEPQDLSSYSNSYIAAQILFIADFLGCSIWEARVRARNTGSENGIFSKKNGYGFIDTAKAIAFTFPIKNLSQSNYNPFFLSGDKNLEFYKPFFLEA